MHVKMTKDFKTYINNVKRIFDTRIIRCFVAASPLLYLLVNYRLSSKSKKIWTKEGIMLISFFHDFLTYSRKILFMLLRLKKTPAKKDF